MSNTTTAIATTEPTTEPVKAAPKAPAKKAPAKKTAPKSEPRKYSATGRSGQEAVRTCNFEASHAVDVKKADAKKAAYQAGVITRFFASKASAEEFAKSVNDGTMAEINDWYRGASSAIVVPVKPV